MRMKNNIIKLNGKRGEKQFTKNSCFLRFLQF